MALSDLAIKKAKPAPKPYKLADSGGLFLLVTPTGGKLWRLKYRHLSGEKTLSIGAYPTVTLAEARQSRDNAKKELSSGLDPSEIKRQAKLAAAEAAAQTFGGLAKEFIARQEAEGMAPATLVKSRRFLEDLATPLADRPIAQITAPEVLALLRTVEAKGNLESAARLRSAIGRIFRYAIVTGRATADPTAALKGALRTPKVRHQPALTDPARVGELLARSMGPREAGWSARRSRSWRSASPGLASCALPSGQRSTWTRPYGPSQPSGRRCAAPTPSRWRPRPWRYCAS
jgi:hypothetical protein